MISQTKKQFLKVAIEAAKAAGALQKKSYGKSHSIQFKGEINLVTEVDKACEKKIIQILTKAFPDHAILAEETGAHDNVSEYKWIIDPLDGTTNYAHGYPCFCVSIGLEYRGQVIVGVVYDPMRNELFSGVRGQGAWLNGKKTRVSEISLLKRSLLSTGFAYDLKKAKDNNLEHFKNFLMNVQAVRRDGAAAIDICYVACGRYDGFWERNLYAWDVAAATLILEESGGKSTMYDGRALDIYGKNIVVSNMHIHDPMLKILKKGNIRG